MGKYFGTDGFRGKANLDLTSEHAYRIGRFLGWYFGAGKHPRVLIGKDTRKSGYMLEYSLVAGLCASGADAYLLHVTTTPSVSYLVRTEQFDCGIMISASHNPYYDNGIKLIDNHGQKIDAEIEDQIERYIDEGVPEIPYAVCEELGKAVDYVAGREHYKQYLKNLVHFDAGSLKIGIDCANGSATTVAPEVFRTVSPGTFFFGSAPNGLNINDGCGSTHIDFLAKAVRENGLDVGFAFDGDADRCVAVDENGKPVNGDIIMYLCGTYLKETGRLKGNTVVTTVMSNLGLYKALAKKGIQTKQTAVGDKYVSEEMIRGGYMLGGEQSGHIIFREHAVTGDGIITALMVLEVMRHRKKTLGELSGEIKIYPQILKNISVHDKQEVKNNPAVRKAVQKAENELGDEGRILVRESGTEQLLRVMVEAGDYDTCNRNAERVLSAIRGAAE